MRQPRLTPSGIRGDAASVHNVIATLERRGLINRTSGQPRSIEVTVPLGESPPLD
jgi:hypothetical protein